MSDTPDTMTTQARLEQAEANIRKLKEIGDEMAEYLHLVKGGKYAKDILEKWEAMRLL